MKILKEVLNTKEEKSISGGSEIGYKSNKGTFQKDNGKHFEIMCDVCRKIIPGKAAIMYDSKENDYCLDCAKKKQAVLKQVGIDEKFKFDITDYAIK